MIYKHRIASDEPPINIKVFKWELKNDNFGDPTLFINDKAVFYTMRGGRSIIIDRALHDMGLLIDNTNGNHVINQIERSPL